MLEGKGAPLAGTGASKHDGCVLLDQGTYLCVQSEQSVVLGKAQTSWDLQLVHSLAPVIPTLWSRPPPGKSLPLSAEWTL